MLFKFSLCTFFALLLAISSGGVRAGEGSVELGGEYASLSAGLGNWEGAYGTFSYTPDPRDRFTLELAYASRFGEQGSAVTGVYQRDYSDDAYQVFSLTGTTAGLFWPSSAISTEYFHKAGGDHNWVIGVGGGYDASRTGNQDVFGVLELVRYLPADLVAEVGSRYNVSEPGTVTAPRGFAALSWLPAPGHEYVLKVDGGGEAYQEVGPEQVQTNFSSIELSAEAFVPIGGGRRIHARAEFYNNPFYDRVLGYLGVSQAF